jgi:hypothetical protein
MLGSIVLFLLGALFLTVSIPNKLKWKVETGNNKQFIAGIILGIVCWLGVLF